MFRDRLYAYNQVSFTTAARGIEMRIESCAAAYRQMTEYPRRLRIAPIRESEESVFVSTEPDNAATRH